MGFSEALAAIQGVVDVGSSLFNIGSQIENTNYQRNLQQTLFNREDNAVFRRMQDLKSAGLNPNLAAGSAANAGSVVQTKAPMAEFGNQLDKVAALSQLEMQKAQTANAQLESKILSNQAKVTDLDKNLALVNYAQQLGLPIYLRNGSTPSIYQGAGDVELSESSPIRHLFNLGLQNAQNNSWLLQLDANWGRANKIIDAASSGVGMVSDIAGTVTGVKNAFNPYQVIKPSVPLKTGETIFKENGHEYRRYHYDYN